MGLKLTLFLLIPALVLSPRDLNSCGPFLPAAVFSLTTQPDKPVQEFARSNLGVLQPTFRREYLIVAYRYLTGLSLSHRDAEAMFGGGSPAAPSTGGGSMDDEYHASNAWQEARAKITSQAQGGYVWSYKVFGSYQNFLNCPADAFHTAIHTLDERVRKYGAASPEVKEWLMAQDQVFSNCNGEKLSIPDAIPGSADRAYQIAAANFYATNFDTARAEFLTIAKDSASPWSVLAPYLAARCLIRKASLQKNDGTPWNQAESELRGLLNERRMAAYHDSIRGLLDYIRVRRHPEQRLAELSRALGEDRTPSRFAQKTADYLYLWRSAGASATAEAGDDLTQWIDCFQSRNCPASPPSSLPWLIAGLSRGGVTDLSAANQVPETSPGYATVSYYAVRTMLEQKKFEEARTRLDALIARKTFPRSAHNLFLAQRMGIARTPNEFLRDAQRVPAGSDDGAGESQDLPKNFEAQAFDRDAALILNGETPLWLLKALAASKILTPALHRDLTRAAWVRAVLLNNDDAAVELAPGLAPKLAGFEAAKTAEERRFAAVVVMLKSPELRPYVEEGLGRLTKPGRIDSFRDNWWAKPPDARAMPEAPWLTSAQRAEGIRESRIVDALTAPNYLAAAVLARAKTHPDDPRLPEALALTVRAARYSHGDEETGKYSKAAFDLLHSRYPTSSWAQQTKYWFN